MQYESGTFTVSRVSTAAGASSKNDGAGCADEEDPHDPDSGSSGPSDISSTVSQSLGTCSGGSATSTLSITNNSSATGYYYVQYKIDSGSYQNADTNLTVGAGVTNTSLSASVSNGSTITWRYIDSDTNNNQIKKVYIETRSEACISPKQQICVHNAQKVKRWSTADCRRSFCGRFDKRSAVGRTTTRSIGSIS